MTTQTEQSVETNVELKKRAGLIASFSYAIDGVLRTLCSQRNMKIHWVSGLAVMLVGMALELDLASRASVIFCVFVVICMEVLNTAFEAFVDLHIKNFARHAMVAKDAAAAAVLVLAVCAVVVFADVLFHRWAMVEASGPAIQRTVLWGLPLLGMVGLILGMTRRVVLIVALGFAAVGALSVLAWFSRDEIFSLGALGFVVSAVVARLREPALEA
ncbi:MAG: diacylglycerol kinase family protein [Deltaproteobacteria bacterium]|jgi:diacylglycerol kinase (ATP)